MDTAGKSAQQLREQVAKAEEELKSLKEQLAQAEAQEQETEAAAAASSGSIDGSTWKWPLKAEEYDRYARQLILPAVGIKGDRH
jgi:adenylyltransferase and sulfurtransferase